MCFNKDNNCCCAITIISALIGAVAIAASFYSSLITSITAITIITLVLGILSLLYIVITSICSRNCKNSNKLCNTPIIVGSIVIPAIALSATGIAAGALSSAILVLAIAFFLIMSLINLLHIIFSFFCCNRCDD